MKDPAFQEKLAKGPIAVIMVRQPGLRTWAASSAAGSSIRCSSPLPSRASAARPCGRSTVPVRLQGCRARGLRGLSFAQIPNAIWWGWPRKSAFKEVADARCLRLADRRDVCGALAEEPASGIEIARRLNSRPDPSLRDRDVEGGERRGGERPVEFRRLPTTRIARSSLRTYSRAREPRRPRSPSRSRAVALRKSAGSRRTRPASARAPFRPESKSAIDGFRIASLARSARPRSPGATEVARLLEERVDCGGGRCSLLVPSASWNRPR